MAGTVPYPEGEHITAMELLELLIDLPDTILEKPITLLPGKTKVWCAGHSTLHGVLLFTKEEGEES